MLQQWSTNSGMVSCASPCMYWTQFVYVNQSSSVTPTGVPINVYGIPGPLALVYIQFNMIGFPGNCPNYTTTIDSQTVNVWNQSYQAAYGIICSTGLFATPLPPNPIASIPAATTSTNPNGTPVPITDLSNLQLVGVAGNNGDKTTGLCGGTDPSVQVTVFESGAAAGTFCAYDPFYLVSYWQNAEFNVFGLGYGSQAQFLNPGTTINVQTAITTGVNAAPSCDPYQNWTAETNNLTLGVCCPITGAIQFAETNDPNPLAVATCNGPGGELEGDPHLTTADGVNYDFQGAGEFVALRDRDGTEIQTRQAPIATTFFPSPDAHDGLATCVSINTAVAARVGGHRITWEPNLSGVPDPTGLQLRVDGVLTKLGAGGLALGVGGRIAPAAGGALEVDFPDGKTLMVTPQWWAFESLWYLNVDVTNLGLISSGNGAYGVGLVGPIAKGSWLPALPNGASLGSMPASLPARYDTLYHTFADAWRVTDKDSLFDYAPGAATETYTNTDWPRQNPPCGLPNMKPVEPASEATAVAACRGLSDENRRANCVFDVTVTGNPGFAESYFNTQRNLAFSTRTILADGDDPSQPGEWVTFKAYVAPYASGATGPPSGTVQFAVNGANAGEPIMVDARGRATWETSRLKVGVNRVTATFVPDADSAFLPSTSSEKVHEVRRCPCGDHREGK
jgi:Bacterial Ig-like domain (group 3)